jgi:predicted AAA+ superfamily ATPase
MWRGSMIVIFGPRQAGKTTLSKTLIKEYCDEGAYFDCQEEYVRRHFEVGEPDLLLEMIKGKKIVVFDEAQTIINIGTVLKVFHDKYKHLGIQIIATGSSSFDLANKIIEPMTGRAIEFYLLPLSVQEIIQDTEKSISNKTIRDIMLYGCYPEVVSAEDDYFKDISIKKIATNYLYKDIFMLESIKNPKAFEDIIRMLAMQVGNMVSSTEIARSVGVNRATVDRYIKLLEQSFIIKRVYSYSTNPRNELKKSCKIYFIDTGVRNAIVGNRGLKLEDREDRGAIFENFIFTELLKKEQIKVFPDEIFFWRTKQGLEIDFIKVDGQNMSAYECKYGGDDAYKFSKFLKEYGGKVKLSEVLSVSNFIEKLNK